jgi:hypothetical protein
LHFRKVLCKRNKKCCIKRAVVSFTKEFENRHVWGHHQKKEKAVPLQAWTGPEGSRRLRLPDF